MKVSSACNFLSSTSAVYFPYIAWLFHHRNYASGGGEIKSILTVDIGGQEPYFISLYIHVCLYPIPPLLPVWPRKASPRASWRTVLAKIHIWVRNVVLMGSKMSPLTMYVSLNKSKFHSLHKSLVKVMIVLLWRRRRKRANKKRLSYSSHYSSVF